MYKEVELHKIKKEEENLFVAKILDKLKMCHAKNRFLATDFLSLAQKSLAIDTLKKENNENYEFFGGFSNAERTVIFFYPDTYLSGEEGEDLEKKQKIYNQFLSCIRIIPPKETISDFTHQMYLGAIIKLGVKREKVGDIIVREDGADIVISKEIEKYLMNNLKLLTRFQKAKIEVIDLNDIKYVEKEKETFNINVPSMRLDAIVGEIAKLSRSASIKYIEEERVFINFKEEIRPTKQILEGDIITIRGKGRFLISKILGKTRSQRLSIEVKKW